MYTLLYIHKLYCYLRTDHSPRYFVLPMHSMIPCQAALKNCSGITSIDLVPVQVQRLQMDLSKQRELGEVCELMENSVSNSNNQRWAMTKDISLGLRECIEY